MRVRVRILVLCVAAAFCTLCLYRGLHLSDKQTPVVVVDAWQERAPRSLSYGGGSRDYESVSNGGVLLPHDYDNNNNEFQLPLDPEVTPSARLLTSLGDIFISVKTTSNYHKSRLDVILKTWFTLAREEVRSFLQKIVSKKLGFGLKYLFRHFLILSSILLYIYFFKLENNWSNNRIFLI